jgi:CDP-diacylglycerol--glycerol-3-phosphate 3-phosphatidyltransferase
MSVEPRPSFLADLRTIPNLLSLLRLVGLPVAASLYIYGFRTLGLTLGTVAAFTDMIDGPLARKLGQTTLLGAVLDRLGDLVLEATGLVVAVHFALISPVAVFAYLLRELVVLSARQFAAERGATIPTTWLGRIKTNFFAFGILLLFVVHAGAIGDPQIARVVAWVAEGGIWTGVAVSWASGGQYLAAFSRIYGGARPGER